MGVPNGKEEWVVDLYLLCVPNGNGEWLVDFYLLCAPNGKEEWLVDLYILSFGSCIFLENKIEEYIVNICSNNIRRFNEFLHFFNQRKKTTEHVHLNIFVFFKIFQYNTFH